MSEVKLCLSTKRLLEFIFILFPSKEILSKKYWGHVIIDANGADISSIMHGINFSYALYYNYVHKRHGHLFRDRFRSKMVKDEKYLLTLSAYAHNNPADVEGYESCPEKYEFSSLSVYLCLRRDPL